MTLNLSTFRAAALVLASLLFAGHAFCAEADHGDVQTAWRLLDYIAIDYAGAVTDGAVTNPVEYAEQLEFAGTAAHLIAGLPDRPGRQGFLDDAARLRAAIADKRATPEVAAIARTLAAALLEVYPVPLAPAAPPDAARGAVLYAEQCAACHGTHGNGDGPAASAASIPPTAFTDLERARERSIFALYQVITQGIADTPMQSFANLSIEDRWALAFHVARLAFAQVPADEGERLWRDDTSLQARIPDLAAFTAMTPASLGETLGTGRADAVTAFLRGHPEVLGVQDAGRLALARERLAQSLAAYRSGERQQARKLALSAYLDGFEPIEPVLGARSPELLVQVEQAMGDYRAAIQRGEGNESLERHALVLNGLFDDAEASLAGDNGSAIAAFLGAATILLREGLEALLIIVAMIAFLHKADRPQALRYVHAGWVGALLAGVATWVVATWAIDISGASRELTEGFGSILAALVLLTVGIWMHGKAQADQWQRYIRSRMSGVLSGRSAWLLFMLAFVAVYREVFETILFYTAIWAQGNGMAMLLGALSAGLVLAVITWAMLRFSQRLRIDRFFSYSSWLMAVLAVVLIGKGVAALQEAGIIDIEPLSFLPRIVAAGFYPTLQTLLAQLAMILGLIAGFGWNRHQALRRLDGG